MDEDLRQDFRRNGEEDGGRRTSITAMRNIHPYCYSFNIEGLGHEIERHTIVSFASFGISGTKFYVSVFLKGVVEFRVHGACAAAKI